MTLGPDTVASEKFTTLAPKVFQLTAGDEVLPVEQRILLLLVVAPNKLGILTQPAEPVEDAEGASVVAHTVFSLPKEVGKLISCHAATSLPPLVEHFKYLLLPAVVILAKIEDTLAQDIEAFPLATVDFKTSSDTVGTGTCKSDPETPVGALSASSLLFPSISTNNPFWKVNFLLVHQPVSTL
jgi:hypothetical protein